MRNFACCAALIVLPLGCTSGTTAGTAPPSNAPVEYPATPYVDLGRYYPGTFVVNRSAIEMCLDENNYPCNFPLSEPVDGTRKILLRVHPDDELLLYGKRPAFRAELVNGTDEGFGVRSCDGQLYLVQEALSPEGEWVAVESFPWTTCGNSYGAQWLAPQSYWEFAIQKFSGDYETKLRLALHVDYETALYSDEYPGSVNSQQLQLEQYRHPGPVREWEPPVLEPTE